MKKELKGFICGVVTTSVLLCGGAFAAGRWTTIDVLQDDITVIVDGEKVTESNFVYNDRTYLPLRAVAEAVNKPVEYDETTNTAYIGNRTDNNIDYKATASLFTKYDDKYNITSFKITSIEEFNINELKVNYEIIGTSTDDFVGIHFDCYDEDGFLIDSVSEIAQNVNPNQPFKISDKAYIPVNTTKIELNSAF